MTDDRNQQPDPAQMTAPDGRPVTLVEIDPARMNALVLATNANEGLDSTMERADAYYGFLTGRDDVELAGSASSE